MVTRLLAIAFLVAGCAGAPAPREGVKIESEAGPPPVVRLLLDKEESFRLSRAGVMDPSSPSGLTDRFRYRMAIERYAVEIMREKGFCPGGLRDIESAPRDGTGAITITAACLPP